MDVIIIRALRFILNFIIYAGILMFTTYYIYTTPSSLYELKNIIVPMKGIMFLCLILAIIFSGVTEITTKLLIYYARRKK